MTNRHKYRFTHHLRERFVQRTDKRFIHLQKCRETNCEICERLLAESKLEARSNSTEIDKEIERRLHESVENRSYINNTNFMAWYHEKYGYDKRFEFRVHEDALFVVVHDKGKKIVVTCISSKTHPAGKSHQKPRFGKLGKKEGEPVWP